MTSFADISHHQGAVDLAAYKRAGHDRIALKATEGTGFTDPTFAARWRRAGQLGLARVAYHFARARFDGADEFDHLLAVVRAAGGLGARDRLCLDVEDPDTPSRAGANARQFAARAVQRGITSGLVYTFRSYAVNHGIAPSLFPAGWRRLWLADYTAGQADSMIELGAGWTRAQVVARQYTDQAHVAGIGSLCDFNRLLREWLTGSPPPEEDEMPITDHDAEKIARAVWAEGLQGEMNAPERAGVILVHTRVWAALIRDLLPGIANRAVDAQASLSALLANEGVVSDLSDEALRSIADAVAAELANRSAEPEV